MTYRPHAPVPTSFIPTASSSTSTSASTRTIHPPSPTTTTTMDTTTTTAASTGSSPPTPYTPYPSIPIPLSIPISLSPEPQPQPQPAPQPHPHPETRTLLTFPTPGLPSPRICAQYNLLAFPVRYPAGEAAPAQARVNRWLCCRCAQEGYRDPVGMVHLEREGGSYGVGVAGEGRWGRGGEGVGDGGRVRERERERERERGVGIGRGWEGEVELEGPFAGMLGEGRGSDSGDRGGLGVYGLGRGSGSERGGTGTDTGTGWGRRVDGDGDRDGNGGRQDYNACWRDSCRHRKCVNCALYPGPLGCDSSAKLLIRTVGGLYASPRFIDPVYWECAGCGEWARNRFDSRSTLGLMGCRNEGCVLAWRAGRAQLGIGAGERGAGDSAPGAGVLMAASVVMNRYGQRLGTADQRVAVADGPWDWQRKALGNARCAIVAGLRAAMKRTGEGMQLDNSADGSRIGKLWIDGEPVPQYPYRRPPPLDDNDAGENNEYESSYLAGLPAESSNKERASLAAAQSAAVHSSSAFFPGWNHSQ